MKSGYIRQRLVLSLAILLLLLVFEFPKGHTISSSISGQVVDVITGQPIEDATVAVWQYEIPRRRGYYREPIVRLKATATTGADGVYEVLVEGSFSCRVYVYHDDPSSPGYDYLPMLQSFTLEKEAAIHLSFEMIPAASVIIEGDVLCVDSSQPPDAYSFTSLVEEAHPSIKECILTYGTSSDSHNHFLNVDQTHVIIPANTALQIEVKALLAHTTHTFVIDDPQFSSVEKGDEVHVTIEQYLLLYNLNVTKDYLFLVETHVNETEQQGFYVLAEKRDLGKAATLIDNAETLFARALYRECYTDLREAYTIAGYIDGKVQVMYDDASVSTTIIFVFLAFTSTTLSYLFSEQRRTNALIAGLIYSLFLVLLYYIYAGCQVIDAFTLLLTAGVSILVSVFIAGILPRVLDMKTTIVFSMAKRNLKVRKTRFILTMITVTALVMGFVSLTSFSIEYGFISAPVGSITPEVEGLLIRRPLPEIHLTAETQVAVTFTALEPSVTDWLYEQPEVILVAPKVENIALRNPLGSLFTSGQRLSLFGVLGLSPQDEVETTGFNTLLVEGRCLQVDEEDAVMISVQAATALNAQVGDRLVLRIGLYPIEVQLVGLLDDSGLQQKTDLDGSPMMPDKIAIEVMEGVVVASIQPCESTEVIVMTWQTALNLSTLISLSRIDALVQSSVDLSAVGRQIALERDYWVWVAADGRINLQGIMPYLESKGASIIIPWIITILSVVITMLNTIYERRREVGILSSVGLNPTNITALFGAEALIIGVIGGGIGYLLGLSLYKIMPLFSVDIVVRQKISATWCLASLGIAVTAVLVGAFAALKSSVIVTPSLLRKWQAEGRPKGREPWSFEIPFRIPQEDISSMLAHVTHALHNYKDHYDIRIDRIHQTEEETPETRLITISFSYHQRGIDGFHSRNTIVASKEKKDNTYMLRLICDAYQEDWAYKTARFVRRIFLEWSVG